VQAVLRCPVHPKKDIVGYCGECGTLGCDQCVKKLQGTLLCVRCYRKQYGKMAAEHQRQARRNRRQKQRLVIRFADGRVLKGISYTIDLESAGFRLTPEGAHPEVDEDVFVKFADVKAVFFVRDFEGKFDPKTVQQEYAPEGSEVTVVFPDGEVIEGFSLTRLDDTSPRFHMIPKDQKGNNISLIVERANTVEIQRGHVAPAMPANTRREAEEAPLSQEETLGDFYFETKNYVAALPQYEQAFAKHRGSVRLKRKISLTKYNVAVHYIKIKEFEMAIRLFEEVLREEPDTHTKFHRAAKRKLLKLQRAMSESAGSAVEVEP